MYSKIKTIHLEGSTGCNATCPTCLRHVKLDNNLVFFNKRVQFNQNLTVDDIDNILTTKNVIEDVSINICGNFGDPLWNKDIVDIVKRIMKWKPFAIILIHTNGSLGTKKTWEQLGKLCPKTLRSRASRFIVFSIDGLEDTNHIYRRNVKWEKVMENLKTFINNNGKAYWKYIVFEHNKHQIEKAKSMATELGFSKFYTDLDNSPDESVPNMKVVKQTVTLNITSKEEYKGFVNKPECKGGKEIYVAADGKVFPCCHFGGDFNTNIEQRRKELESVYKIYNIREEGFSTIVNDKLLWDKLDNSIETNPIKTCIRQCGQFMK